MSLFGRWFSKKYADDGHDEGEADEGDDASGAFVLSSTKGELARSLGELEARGRHDEARRVAEVLADMTVEPASRVAWLARALAAAERAGAPPKALQGRYARARLDVLTQANAPSTWELSTLAQQLEELDEHLAAAEAFALAGDTEGQARALAAGGHLERLEGVLTDARVTERSRRQRAHALQEITALDAAGQRAAALARARSLRDGAPHDAEVQRVIAGLEARLVRGVELTLAGPRGRARWRLGCPVELGRVGADLTVASPLVSRRHLRFSRDPTGTPTVEDLSTRNGTFIAGARLAAPLAVRGPIELSIGGELICSVTPHDDGSLAITLAGETWSLPLADHANLGPWRLVSRDGALRLCVPDGAPAPILGDGVAAPEGLDPCVGDVVRAARGEAEVFRVLG